MCVRPDRPTARPCDRQIGSQFWSRKMSNLRAERFRTENFRARAWRVFLGVVTVRFSDKLNIHFVNDRSCVVLRHDSIHESSVRLDLRATLHCRSYLVLGTFHFEKYSIWKNESIHILEYNILDHLIHVTCYKSINVAMNNRFKCVQ